MVEFPNYLEQPPINPEVTDTLAQIGRSKDPLIIDAILIAALSPEHSHGAVLEVFGEFRVPRDTVIRLLVATADVSQKQIDILAGFQKLNSYRSGIIACAIARSYNLRVVNPSEVICSFNYYYNDLGGFTAREDFGKVSHFGAFILAKYQDRYQEIPIEVLTAFYRFERAGQHMSFRMAEAIGTPEEGAIEHEKLVLLHARIEAIPWFQTEIQNPLTPIAKIYSEYTLQHQRRISRVTQP